MGGTVKFAGNNGTGTPNIEVKFDTKEGEKGVKKVQSQFSTFLKMEDNLIGFYNNWGRSRGACACVGC